MRTKEIYVIDIFDVLLKSLILEDKDIYKILSFKFREIYPNRQIIDFCKIRSEIEEKMDQPSLNKIYDAIKEKYKLNENVNQLKTMEVELLNKLYIVRNSTIKKIKGKKIILISKKCYDVNTLVQLLKEKGLYTKLNIIDIIICNKKNLEKHLISLNSKFKVVYFSSYYDEIDKCKKNNINNYFYPKTTDIFMGYINESNVNFLGLINKKMTSDFVNLKKYTEIFGVRLSIALVASKVCDNECLNLQNDFDDNKDLVGYYAFGMHLLSICRWLNSVANKNSKIVFLSRDGFVPKKAYEIFSGDKTEYFYISRKAYLPAIITQAEDMFMLKNYINIKFCTKKNLIEIIHPILKNDKNIKLMKKDECFKDENDFDEFITLLTNFFDIEKRNKYLSYFEQYLNMMIDDNTILFDIGYSGFPEYVISNLIKKNIITCFIHSNNSSSYEYSQFGNKFKIYNFYNYSPKYTATLREILISDTKPSCINYQDKKGNFKLIFEKQKLAIKNIKTIESIQSQALNFVKDFSEIHREYLEYIDMNNFYMSLPFEYFMHKTTVDEKRKIFGEDFKFEINENEYINLVDEWEKQLK